MFPTVMNTAKDAIYKLNWIKDEVESEENVTMMERYTAQLKELERSGTIESAGSYDQLNRMFVPEKGSHQIGLLSRFAKDTGIKCGSDPIQPDVVLRYLESRRGIIFEDGVIFADVPENFFR